MSFVYLNARFRSWAVLNGISAPNYFVFVLSRVCGVAIFCQGRDVLVTVNSMRTGILD